LLGSGSLGEWFLTTPYSPLSIHPQLRCVVVPSRFELLTPTLSV
jgi:hypothetical protein